MALLFFVAFIVKNILTTNEIINMRKTLRFLIIAMLAAFSFNSEAKNLSEYISLLQPNDISNIDKNDAIFKSYYVKV